MGIKYTMQDVADAAGVSKSTVSRALRGHPSIPVDTRKRIAEAAHKLGYSAHPMVAALMANLRQSKLPDTPIVVGYITFSDTWRNKPILLHMYEGAVERGRELGFKIEEFHYNEKDYPNQRLNQILAYRRIPGVLLAPPIDPHQTVDLDWSRLSGVTVGAVLPGRRISCVRHNHFQGVLLAFQTLLKRGYQRIGFFTTKNLDQRVHGRWVAGFLYSQLQVSPSQRIEPVILSEKDRSERFKEIFMQWVTQTRADAVILTTSDNGEEYDWAEELGLSVPQAFGIAVLSHRSYIPRIAGVSQRPQMVGATAMDVLASMVLYNITSDKSTYQEVSLDGEWIDAPSVRPAPSV